MHMETVCLGTLENSDDGDINYGNTNDDDNDNINKNINNICLVILIMLIESNPMVVHKSYGGPN